MVKYRSIVLTDDRCEGTHRPWLVWKALNVKDYPLRIRQQASKSDGTNTRAFSDGRPCEIGKSTITQSTCVSDAIKLWNRAPMSIKIKHK